MVIDELEPDIINCNTVLQTIGIEKGKGLEG